jgi:tRNA-dihydrouridine synthase B
MFKGTAEYDTISAIKAAVHIPVFANGDIDSPQKARTVLEQTGVDGLMIGRSAQGNPWIFREIEFFLRTGKYLPRPSNEEVRAIMRAHLRNLYAHYGEWAGVNVARKHIAWYVNGRPHAREQRSALMQAATTDAQLAWLDTYFDGLAHDNVTTTGA